MKCEVCFENPSQYKCPKCLKRYCSSACYNDKVKHIHNNIEPKLANKALDVESVADEKLESKMLHIEKILDENPKLKGLLKHNTVKYHLHKVYRILTTSNGAIGTNNNALTNEEKGQLAVDYINTLRYGGIDYNEAIEEFCEACMELVQKE